MSIATNTFLRLQTAGRRFGLAPIRSGLNEIYMSTLIFFYKEWSRPSVKKEHLSLNHNLPVNLVFQDLLKSAHSTWYFLPSNCSFADSFKSDHGFIIHTGTPPRNCSRNTRASPSHGYTSRSSSMPLHLMIVANNTLRIC